MNLSYGVSWNDAKKLRTVASALAAAVALSAAPGLGLASASATPPYSGQAANSAAPVAGPQVSVIVRQLDGAGDLPERTVAALGGQVGRALDIIGGFEARVPVSALGRLSNLAGVHSVTENGPVQLHDAETEQYSSVPSSMAAVAQEVTGAGEMWNAGFTGQGVDVAVIDTGVVEVNGLAAPGKVVYGPDLSYEADFEEVRNKDTYGHGTHMAGIIAGRDNEAPSVIQKGNKKNFLGMAPDARIVSVKVGDAEGATDVSQVIAAIDWVVQNKSANGLNIRVLNLSFGTDGTQDYKVDPLTYAAEVAWRKGIVVVASAGNGGNGTAKLDNPAHDPFLIAVGGADGNATYDTADDTVREWSAGGDGTRNPDLVAPGKSIIGLRDEGSYLDVAYPGARVGTRFFKGSGTSQAAAVVSGAAALLIEQRPTARPDQIKALLERTAQRLPQANSVLQGSGMVDLKEARVAATPLGYQTWTPATGTGSLELSRGTVHTEEADGTALTGETDAFGGAWDGRSWSGRSWSGTAWSGGSWSGRSWSGGDWLGRSWSGRSWSGLTWLGRSWSGRSWSGRSWSGRSWSGSTWSSSTWQ